MESLGEEQAYYQPPDPKPVCKRCDGERELLVRAVEGLWYDLRLGKFKMEIEEFSSEEAEKRNLFIRCYRCKGTGVEPLPDSDDIALERARQKGFEYD